MVGIAIFIISTGISLTGLTWMMVVEHNSTLINSIELVLCALVLRKLIDIIPTDEKIVSLEGLEYQILLYDMDTEQIKSRFNDIWFDKSVVNLVNEKDVIRKNLLNKAMAIEDELIKMLEMPGVNREAALCLHESLNTAMSELRNYCQQSQEEFKKLALRITMGDEHLRIVIFLNEVDRQIQAINNAYATYSRRVQDYLTKKTEEVSYVTVEAAATTEPPV